MQNIVEQKVRLDQKKNRLIAEETRLKLKERKMRTRHLIEVGGLVTKAGLDYLSTNTLYGALLSIAASLEANQVIKDEWAKIGKTKLDQEQINKYFTEEVDSDRAHIGRWRTDERLDSEFHSKFDRAVSELLDEGIAAY